MNKKFYTYLTKEFLPKASSEQKVVTKKVISLLLKANILTLNTEELERVLHPPVKSVISPKEIEQLTEMVMRMLPFELDRLKEDRLTGEQELNFGENGISTAFLMPKKIQSVIKKQCEKAGWEVQEIKALAIRLKKKAKTKKRTGAIKPK